MVFTMPENRLLANYVYSTCNTINFNNIVTYTVTVFLYSYTEVVGIRAQINYIIAINI